MTGTPEFIEQHPMWEGAVVGFLFAAEAGLVHPDDIIPTMTQVCVELVQDGMLDNFGELQTYLRQRDAFVQLVAKPFDPETIPYPDIRCIDLTTREPRGHWLVVAVGRGQAALELDMLGTTPEANEAILATDTGILAVQ